jgi:hypothetical protein
MVVAKNYWYFYGTPAEGGISAEILKRPADFPGMILTMKNMRAPQA